jgi:exodeoxyribonuclease-3
MKLLAWNIRHGGSKNGALAAAIITHSPDVIVLGEYRAEGSEQLVQQLRFFGWPDVHASAVSGIANGVAILSRERIEPKPAPIGLTPHSQWAVEVGIPSAQLNVIGIYAPLANSFGSTPTLQREFWQGVQRVMETRKNERILLVGDFNTCAPGTDGPTALACSDIFERLPDLGWVDGWRACNAGLNDFSYVQRNRDGKSNWRIDHAFVSLPLAPSVGKCRYSHAEREQGLSDHSMLIVEIN